MSEQILLDILAVITATVGQKMKLLSIVFRTALHLPFTKVSDNFAHNDHQKQPSGEDAEFYQVTYN